MVGEASGRMQKADCRDEIALPAAMLAWLKCGKQRTRNSRKRFLVFFCSLFVKARVVYRLPQHSKREYFSVLSHDIFLYRRLCLYVHIQPGFERYVDAVIEYRGLLYQFPDKDVIYLITSRHPYTHTRLCGPVHHGL